MSGNIFFLPSPLKVGLTEYGILVQLFCLDTLKMLLCSLLAALVVEKTILSSWLFSFLGNLSFPLWKLVRFFFLSLIFWSFTTMSLGLDFSFLILFVTLSSVYVFFWFWKNFSRYLFRYCLSSVLFCLVYIHIYVNICLNVYIFIYICVYIHIYILIPINFFLVHSLSLYSLWDLFSFIMEFTNFLFSFI